MWPYPARTSERSCRLADADNAPAQNSLSASEKSPTARELYFEAGIVLAVTLGIVEAIQFLLPVLGVAKP
jgi:hypothetical protein